MLYVTHQTCTLLFPYQPYPDLLLNIVEGFSIDPTAYNIIFSSPVKDFILNSNFYNTLTKKLPKIKLNLLKINNNRPGFDYILSTYKETTCLMSEKVRLLYKAYLISDSPDISSLEIDKEYLDPDPKYCLFILPFLKHLNAVYIRTSTYSKYAINLLTTTLLGQRSKSLENRLKTLELELRPDASIPLKNFYVLPILSLPSLEVLDLSYTLVKDLHINPYGPPSFSLKALNLSGCNGLNFEDVLTFCSACPNLDSLELNQCQLNSDHISFLQKLTNCGRFNNLKRISLRDNYFNGCRDLGSTLGNMSNLEFIDISGCCINPQNFVDVTYGIVVCVRLTHLYVSGAGLNGCVSQFVELLKYINMLLYLDISKNLLRPQDLISILQKLPNLVLLDITDNLATPLVINYLPLSLNYLYLGPIQEFSCIPCTSLHELEIEFDTHTTAKALLNDIKKNKDLKILGLIHLMISDTNFEVFSGTIKSLNKLEIIDLNEAYCEDIYMKKINEALLTCFELKLVGYSHTMLSSEKLYLLYKINSRNKHFRHNNKFAAFKDTDLLPDAPRCKLCHRYCYYPDICKWVRIRNFIIERQKSFYRLV
jgi:CRISPR/Cas system endoribonuclease Cas6 (RAMP superfamily)